MMLRTLEHVLSFTTCKCSFLVPLGRLIKLPLTFVALNELHYMLPSGLRFVPLRLPFGRIVAPKGQNGGDKERRTPLKGTKGVSLPLRGNDFPLWGKKQKARFFLGGTC